MKIAVMGAGGVGAYVGARLQIAGQDVVYLARGAHLEAMRTDGLRIESPNGSAHLPRVAATDRPSEVGPVDLILFTVKLWDTESAAASLTPMMGPHTRVITLQNGIDSIRILSKRIPHAQLVPAVIYISTVIARPGVIASPGGFHRIVADAAGGDAAVAAFCEACGRADGIECSITETIDRVLWEKFITISAISGATALMRASMGAILANTEARFFLSQLIIEGVQVARAAGQAIADAFIDKSLAGMAAMPPSFRASMAEDLERGRRLELPWLSGRLHQLGLELGVRTPGHSAVYRALAIYADGPVAAT